KDRDSKSVEPGTYKIEALISSNPEVFANSYRIRIEGNKQELKSETIGIGTQSGYHKRSALVIKDNAEWEKIWNLHTSNLDQIPRIPAVDFKTEIVIAIFRGEFRTSGYATEITNITEFSDKIVVTVTETDENGGFVLDVLTYPFHIVKLKRSELPVEFVYKKVIR
ncbi:MAG: protease complex subunit PrcB family protein, partial [Candidatus Poribacteria bacterium]